MGATRRLASKMGTGQNGNTPQIEKLAKSNVTRKCFAVVVLRQQVLAWFPQGNHG
jgi:hypothetical protein